MSQSIKEQLVETLDRLSPEKLSAVLHFVRSIEPEGTDQATDGLDGEKAEQAVADFIAAAGCGQSGDPNSSLRIDEILYGRCEKP